MTSIQNLDAFLKSVLAFVTKLNAGSITALTPPESLAATTPSTSTPLRVGLVQHRWHEDQDDLYTELSEGIASAAKLGASVVFLPELTLSRYPASTPAGDNPGREAEDLLTGPTLAFAAKAAAANQVLVHASLYERSEAEDGLGFNTAIDPRGFAMKFYTEEGNYDLVGNNTPVFFIKDAIKFPDFIRSQKRLPGSGLRDHDMQWDFWTLRPETAHQVTWLMGDRGIPKTWRNMDGFGSIACPVNRPAPSSQMFCRPFAQDGQRPHAGMKARTTWSPSSTLATPGPTFVTTPAPSCPPKAG